MTILREEHFNKCYSWKEKQRKVDLRSENILQVDTHQRNILSLRNHKKFLKKMLMRRTTPDQRSNVISGTEYLLQNEFRRPRKVVFHHTCIEVLLNITRE